jgi:hypothetical protein
MDPDARDNHSNLTVVIIMHDALLLTNRDLTRDSNEPGRSFLADPDINVMSI